MSKVLSFDQSTRVSGWAYFEDNKYIESGVIDMSKTKLETDKRSFEMAKELWKIIRKYNPDILCIEDVQNQSNAKTMIVLARLAGMIIGYAEAHKIDIYIITSTQWRSMLDFKLGAGVKREELKQQSIDYVKETYGVDVPEDEAEAIALGSGAHIKYNL